MYGREGFRKLTRLFFYNFWLFLYSHFLLINFLYIFLSYVTSLPLFTQIKVLELKNLGSSVVNALLSCLPSFLFLFSLFIIFLLVLIYLLFTHVWKGRVLEGNKSPIINLSVTFLVFAFLFAVFFTLFSV